MSKDNSVEEIIQFVCDRTFDHAIGFPAHGKAIPTQSTYLSTVNQDGVVLRILSAIT